MLDNSENQRLHDRIAEVAALISPLGAASTSSPQGGTTADCLPFSKQKIDRILERVYERLVLEASPVDDPTLRQMLAEAVAHREQAAATFSEGKTQRILARLEARLNADKTAAARKPARKVFALAGLRSAAAAWLRRSFTLEARLLSDNHRPRPLTDGPAE